MVCHLNYNIKCPSHKIERERQQEKEKFHYKKGIESGKVAAPSVLLV